MIQQDLPETVSLFIKMISVYLYFFHKNYAGVSCGIMAWEKGIMDEVQDNNRSLISGICLCWLYRMICTLLNCALSMSHGLKREALPHLSVDERTEHSVSQ